MERHGNRMLQEFTFSYIPLDEEIIHTSKLNDKIQNNPTKHSLNGQNIGTDNVSIDLQKTMHTKWLKVKEMSEEKLTMPPKYHCIDHAIAFCILWELTLGY